MRSPLALLPVLLAGCAANAAGAPAETDPSVPTEYICAGRVTDREVRVKVMATTREEAAAAARKQYPEMLLPNCQINIRR